MRSIWIGVVGVAAWLYGTAVHASQLNFGEANEEELVNAASLYPYRIEAMIAFAIYIIAFLLFTSYLVLRPKRLAFPAYRLGMLPDAAKALLTLMFAAYALVHGLALLEVYIKSKSVFSSAEEYFNYMQIGKLVATSHAHFFGHGTMYSLTGAVFLFTSLNEKIKVLMICMALGGGLIDVPTWWMIKYAGGSWELASAIAGSMAALGWSGMVTILLYQLWGPQRPVNQSNVMLSKEN